jgi:hypothetical protein
MNQGSSSSAGERTTVQLPTHGRTSPNGDLDHGPLCFLRAIASAKRNEAPDLLAAIIADPRFDQTDAPTVVEMMVMSSEGFPLPKEIPLGAMWPPVQMVRELGSQWRLRVRMKWRMSRSATSCWADHRAVTVPPCSFTAKATSSVAAHYGHEQLQCSPGW